MRGRESFDEDTRPAIVSNCPFQMTPDPLTDLSARIAAGDPRAIARAISLVEDDGDAGRELVSRIYTQTGRAFLVGVTGAPNRQEHAGRSSDRGDSSGLKVGVIAVDPTPVLRWSSARRSCAA